MLKLRGKTIYIRALEPSDLDFLYSLENNTDIWEVSGTITPYSRHLLKKYLENAHRDIFEVKQLRLCICDLEDRVMGLIDLYDFDPRNGRAGMGIVIAAAGDRNKGYGSEAISMVCDYGAKVLNLHQVFANVGAFNEPSLKLFEKLGFERIGIKKDWIRSGNEFSDEIMLQKILN